MATKNRAARPGLVPPTARSDFSVAAPDRAAFRSRVCGFVIGHAADVETFTATTADERDVLHFQIATAPAWPATVWAEFDALVRSLGGVLVRPDVV